MSDRELPQQEVCLWANSLSPYQPPIHYLEPQIAFKNNVIFTTEHHGNSCFSGGFNSASPLEPDSRDCDSTVYCMLGYGATWAPPSGDDESKPWDHTLLE